MRTSRQAPSRHAPGRSPLFLTVILAAQLMVVLDTTIVNVALPHIQQALDFSSSGLSWVLNAYVLAFGGLLLLGARAGDLVGRRRVFLGGIALFTFSSLAGGLATAGWTLLVARALQGAGAAFAAPSALSLLTSAFSEGSERVRAIGLYTTVSAAGAAIGLIVGGLLTEWVSWRWVMFVNVPIGLAIVVVGRSVLTETGRRRGRFDLAGAFTSTIGMGAIVLGLVEAGTDGWTGRLTLGSFVAGVALLGLFVHTENRAEEPILPLRLLAHRTRTIANVSRGLLYAGMYGMFFFLSLFLQDVQRYSSLRTGLAFLPIPAAVFLASQLTSRVLVRRLAQKTVMLSGIGLAAAGLLVVTRLQLDTSYLELVASLVLVGVGVGISFVSLTSASLAGVEPGDAGAASGLVNVSQQIGAAAGLAVLVTIFATVTDHAAMGGAGHAADPGQFEALLVHGLRTVFGVALLFAVAAFALVGAMVRAPRKVEAVDAEGSPEDEEALALSETFVAEVA
jgi:EmrB/QacA subfamily drug resistance transporter